MKHKICLDVFARINFCVHFVDSLLRNLVECGVDDFFVCRFGGHNLSTSFFQTPNIISIGFISGVYSGPITNVWYISQWNSSKNCSSCTDALSTNMMMLLVQLSSSRRLRNVLMKVMKAFLTTVPDRRWEYFFPVVNIAVMHVRLALMLSP